MQPVSEGIIFPERVRLPRFHDRQGILEWHHCVPRSRDGSDGADNIVHLNTTVHRRWHNLAQNMRCDELIHVFYTMFTDWWKSRQSHQLVWDWRQFCVLRQRKMNQTAARIAERPDFDPADAYALPQNARVDMTKLSDKLRALWRSLFGDIQDMFKAELFLRGMMKPGTRQSIDAVNAWRAYVISLGEMPHPQIAAPAIITPSIIL